MSFPSEQPPTDPQDPLHYAPRRSAERLEPRLAAVNETPFERPAVADAAARLPVSTAALSSKLESAVVESLRRQMEPEAVAEPTDFRHGRSQRAVMGVVIGVAAAVVVAGAVAVAFVSIFPREKNAGASFAKSAPPAATTLSQQRPVDERSHSALSQFRRLLANGEGDQAFTHEQSERLLQQFVQWRQKAVSTQKP
jgi:hypothetical protein